MKRLALLLLLVPLIGCEGLKRLTEGATSTPAAPGPAADYTVAGQTTSDFELIQPVRVAGSDITVRVKRPNEDWTECDQFEVTLSSKGVGGGGLRFGYRNLYVNGIARPVAPAGSRYAIRSVLRP